MASIKQRLRQQSFPQAQEFSGHQASRPMALSVSPFQTRPFVATSLAGTRPSTIATPQALSSPGQVSPPQPAVQRKKHNFGEIPFHAPQRTNITGQTTLQTQTAAASLIAISPLQTTSPNVSANIQLGRNKNRSKSKGKNRKNPPSKKSSSTQGSGSIGGHQSSQTTPRSVTATNAPSAFAEVAPLLEIAAPYPNSSGEVEVSVTIPLSVGIGAELKFDLSGAVERDENGGFEVSLDVAAGAGGEVGLESLGIEAELLGQYGTYIESKASTSTQAMQLFSYALYRQFRESAVLPREVANVLWGEGGTTGKSRYEESEGWAATLEKEVFENNDEAEVTFGQYLSGEASGELGSMELGGGIKLASETTYSKETLGQQLGKAGKKIDDSRWIPWLVNKGSLGYLERGAQESVGETERKLELSTEISVGSMGGEAELTIPLKGFTPNPGEYELSIGFTVNLSESGSTGEFVAMLLEAIAQAQGLISKYQTWAKNNEHLAATSVGILAAIAPTVQSLRSFFDSYSNAKDELRTLLKDGFDLSSPPTSETEEEKAGFSAEKSIQVEVSAERDDTKKLKKETSIQYSRKYEGKIPKVLEASITQGKTLIKLEGPPFKKK